MQPYYSFDDILIAPSNRTFIQSRSEIELEPQLIYSASMSCFDVVYENDTPKPFTRFAEAMAEAGAMHILSRGINFSDRLYIARQMGEDVGISVSLDEFLVHRSLLDQLEGLVSIDIANGGLIPDIISWDGAQKLMIGNYGNPYFRTRRDDTALVTYKLGVGPGAACTTRTATGIGFPQASLIALSRENLGSKVRLVADGGINTSGDFAKAVALGANAVMLGKYFAAAEETPTEVRYNENREMQIKPYWGMASSYGKEVMGKDIQRNIEGGVVELPYYGATVKELVDQLTDGLRSAMSYTNSLTIEEFQDKPEIIHVTNSVIKENSTRGY